LAWIAAAAVTSTRHVSPFLQLVVTEFKIAVNAEQKCAETVRNGLRTPTITSSMLCSMEQESMYMRRKYNRLQVKSKQPPPLAVQRAPLW